MERNPLRTSLFELTVEARTSLEKRRDWDWVICCHIRKWEDLNKEQYRREGLRLINGHFGWFHMYNVCGYVFSRAVRELQAEEDSLLAPENFSGRVNFETKMRRDMVKEECMLEFQRLARAVNEHGLALYVKEQ